MKAKTNVSKAKSRRGFTLVEMLVVIGMIAALAGISFPVYKSIQKKVERQQTAMFLTSIERAVDNFETEYNYLPYAEAAYPTAEQTYYWATGLDTFVGILMGLESTKNFKKIKFLEADEASGSGPITSDGRGPDGYYDGVIDNGDGTATLFNSFGMCYVMRLDHDLDGDIYCNTLKETVTSNRRILIWSPGAAVWDNTRDDWLTSW